MNAGANVRRRFCASGLGLAALVVTTLVPARAQEDPEAGRPTVFEAGASVFAVRGTLNPDPPAAVPEVLAPTVPQATAHFGSGGLSRATATIFDPGLLFTDGANLVCTAGFPCTDFPLQPFPPPYPLEAHAQHPTQPDATATIEGQAVGTGPVAVTGGQAVAHAGRDFVASTGVAEDFTLGATAGPDTAVFHVGSAVAETSLAFDDGVLVARARSFVSDLSALAGGLTIDSIETISISRSTAEGLLDNESHVIVQGAAVGGQPVQITEDGIGFGPGEPTGPGDLDPLGDALEPALAPLHGTVRILGTTDNRDPASNRASGEAVGLLIEVVPNRDRALPVGVVSSLVVGGAATSSRSFEPPPAGLLPPVDVDVGTPGPGGGAPPAGFVPGTSGTPGTPGAPGTGGEGPTTIRTVASELLRHPLAFFYLAWTLSMIGCALASRLRPARLAAP